MQETIQAKSELIEVVFENDALVYNEVSQSDDVVVPRQIELYLKAFGLETEKKLSSRAPLQKPRNPRHTILHGIMPLKPVSNSESGNKDNAKVEENLHSTGDEETVKSENERRKEQSVIIRNRRKTYLDRNFSYFSTDLELADPLLYDRLIRKFQTPSEREAEGRAKGYSGVLEADLLRSEAKLTALAKAAPDQALAYRRAPDRTILPEDQDEAALTKEEAESRWRQLMAWRFLRGDDAGFDYKDVDDNEAYDDQAEQRRDEEEKYFREEKPSWFLDEGLDTRGETGVQDF